MKLEMFDIIDRSINLFQENLDEYEIITKKIKHTLISVLDPEIQTGISTRIKSEMSLREKIIRNRYYLTYETPREIIGNMHDLIGLKIDVRFIEDEGKAYQQLKEYFTEQLEDGFYSNEHHPNLALEMGSVQPQKQKNGYTIYRIDGYYLNGTHKVRFELQIKSLVNSFWSDIEHKLVYKNHTFRVADGLIKDMLSSIKANLVIIDRQLHIIYDSLDNESEVSNKMLSRYSFEELISKAINDLCLQKLQNSIGFGVDIRGTSTILGHYIFEKDLMDYSNKDQILSLLGIFKRIQDDEMDFENHIEVHAPKRAKDAFSNAMSAFFIDVMNKDFEWYVFFKILFAIEPGNNDEDFRLFIGVYHKSMIEANCYDDYFKSCSQSDVTLIVRDMELMLAQALIQMETIEIVHNERIHEIQIAYNSFLNSVDKRIINYVDFAANKEMYQSEITHSIAQLFS
ncbi:hypothetical protein A4S06_03520 [Erysipelotrichaceae bacterium MTC7]|nr:hypothetical protein A4S06_03520 [Erysipelotrichaceae bacterium MTC7]